MIKLNLHYARPITPKRVTSGGAHSPRLSTCSTQLRRNVAVVESHWRHCFRFDRPGIRTPDLPPSIAMSQPRNEPVGIGENANIKKNNENIYLRWIGVSIKAFKNNNIYLPCEKAGTINFIIPITIKKVRSID